MAEEDTGSSEEATAAVLLNAQSVHVKLPSK